MRWLTIIATLVIALIAYDKKWRKTAVLFYIITLLLLMREVGRIWIPLYVYNPPAFFE